MIFSCIFLLYLPKEKFYLNDDKNPKTRQAMKFFRESMLFTLLWLLTSVGYAQQILPFSQHIDTRSKAVFCIFQDADGIWWCGTSQGLVTSAQLVGNSHHVYSRHPELENNIVQIQQDNIGRLWLTTQANKYMVYNPRTNELIVDIEKYLQQMDIKVWYDFRIHIDEEGKVWLYKENQLYVHDFRSKVTRHFILPASSGYIVGVASTRQQCVVLAEKAAYQTSVIMNKIRPVFLTHTPENFQYGKARCELTNKGDLWAYADSHLYTYFASSKTWKQRTEVVPDLSSILCLPDDQVYISTTNTGIYAYDSNGRFFTHAFQSLPLVNGLMNNHIETMYYDPHSKLIAVAYHKHGVTLFQSDSYEIREHYVQWSGNLFNVEDIISFALADKESVWLGTEDNGVYRVKLDGSDKIVENRFPKTTITALMKDKQGRLWAGAYHEGLFCSDGRKYFIGESPYNILEVSPRRFFVLLNGKGVFAFNPQTGEKTHIPTENLWVMDIASLGDYVFVATPKFLYKINKYTLQSTTVPASAFKHSNFCNGNKTILADSRGWVWLVNYKGHSPVDIYDAKTGKTFQCRELQDYEISSLREDGHGHIWCATDQGMVVVKVNQNRDEATKQEQSYLFDLYCFGIKSPSLFNYRAMMNIDCHRLLVGTTQGFLMVDVNRLEKSMASSQMSRQMIISSLRINDNYVAPGIEMNGRVLVESDLPYLRKLHLKYYENNIMIECHPKGLASNGLSSYYYKLEGLSKDWLPMDNNVITLSNLPSGNYRLLLKEQDINHHEFQETELLSIEVDPSFWNSAWGYLLYILVLAVLGYLAYRYYHRRQEYRAKVREIRLAALREKEVNDMKLQFFTNISHDLRTPLTLILTPVESLLNTVKDTDMQQTLGIVYRNAKNLFGLVNQILDFRKLENSSSKLNLSHCDIVAFVQEKLKDFQLVAKEMKIDLVLQSEEEKLEMAFDKDKMGKVINNLLSNALKYTAEGGKISVCIHRHDAQLCVEVRDTGIGISDAAKQNIFDKFYTSTPDHSKMSSVGLGLHIVKEFAELWGGRVDVEDNLPQGTCFKVYVPMLSMQADAQPTEMQTELVAQTLAVEKRDATILLVEDNLDLLGYMAQVLSREYHVCQTTDGLQALQILQGTEVDIIVSDIMMEGMDGYELCKSVKGDINTFHIPFLLLTAKSMTQDEIKGLELGANDYMTKPFNFDILRLRIRRLLDRVKLARERISAEDDIKPSEVTVTTLDEQLLADTIRIVEENMGDTKFNVDDLSDKLCMHRTNLYKKLQFITGKTPSQFIRMMRLKRGKQLLSRGNVLISQVAYEVGFNDPKKFARYFKEEFGMYPSEYVKSMEQK